MSTDQEELIPVDLNALLREVGELVAPPEGIEEKHFGRIFQIFQTLAARDTYESTGIGLTMVKKNVERAGGYIWVESKVGEGSCFSFIVPKKHPRIDAPARHESE